MLKILATRTNLWISIQPIETCTCLRPKNSKQKVWSTTFFATQKKKKQKFLTQKKKRKKEQTKNYWITEKSLGLIRRCYFSMTSIEIYNDEATLQKQNKKKKKKKKIFILLTSNCSARKVKKIKTLLLFSKRVEQLQINKQNPKQQHDTPKRTNERRTHFIEIHVGFNCSHK